MPVDTGRLGHDLKRELDLLTLVVHFGFEKGWITETEKLQISTKATLDIKKSALYDILTNTRSDANAGRLLCALRCIDEMKLEATPNSNTIAEHSCLSLIMSKLYTNGLATKVDKLLYENRLLDKMTKENAVEKEKLECSKTETGVSVQHEFEKPKSENQSIPIENSKNPMLIVLVVKCVLQFLDFEEVKNARNISEVWSSVGLNVLKSRYKIKFSQKTSTDSTNRTPLNFLSMFPTEPLETGSFTSYGFYGENNPISWTIEELNYFFRCQGKNIKKLEFDDIHLVDENWQRCKNYDISAWLMNSVMTKPNTKYNTRLDISVSRYTEGSIYNNAASTPIFVQLSALLNIKELRFLECDVHVQEGILISPTKIEFEDVDFYKNGNKLTQICINDFVDFSKAKEINLIYNDTETNKVFLDMGKSVDIKLESLSLWDIILKNLGTCKWNVNQLHLDYVSFTERSRMEFKELTVSSSEVDISVLPQSIEKLLIYSNRRSNIFCSQPIILHNLKTMKLNFDCIRNSEILGFLHSRILKCPVLVELHLENDTGSTPKVRATLIPQTLKILTIRGIRIEDDGNNTLNLDKLVLSQYPLCKLGEVCGNGIQTTNLVVDYQMDRIPDVDGFLHFLNNQNICRSAEHRIFAGKFDWQKYPENMFEESPLKSYVDKKAEYYVFENKVGKAINQEEFARLRGNFD